MSHPRDPKKVGVRPLIRKVSGSIKDDRDPHEGRSWGRGSRRPVRCPGTQKVPAPRPLPGREDKPQCTPLAGPWLPNGGTTWEGFGPRAPWASSCSQILCASRCLSARATKITAECLAPGLPPYLRTGSRGDWLLFIQPLA